MRVDRIVLWPLSYQANPGGIRTRPFAETSSADLPEWPNDERLNAWLATTYRQWWER